MAATWNNEISFKLALTAFTRFKKIALIFSFFSAYLHQLHANDAWTNIVYEWWLIARRQRADLQFCKNLHCLALQSTKYKNAKNSTGCLNCIVNCRKSDRPSGHSCPSVRLFAQDIQTWAGHWSGQLGPIGFDNLKRGSVFLFWTYKTKASQVRLVAMVS